MDERPDFDPVSLNKAIKNLFHRLKEAHTEEEATILITEIYRHADQNKNLVNAVTFAMLFNRLGKTDAAKQKIAKKLILFTIHYSSEHLKKHPQKFTFREVVQIICALPSLPIAWDKHSKFAIRLIRKFNHLLDEEIKLQDSELINLLCALARLGFLVSEPLPILLKMIKRLECTEEKIGTFPPVFISQLWQFCVYAKSRFENEEIIFQLFTWVNSRIRANPHPSAESSEFHLALVDFLKRHLKKEFADELQLEYIVGAYALDIGLPSVKLNIEVDGNQHYRDESLIRKDRFRDFLLKYYDQWNVIRIPLREFTHLRTQEKLEYLQERLGDFAYILKPFAPNVMRGLEKNQLLNKKTGRPDMPRPSKPTKKDIQQRK